MLVPLCNCNRHFSILPCKTLLNHSIPISHCHYSNLLLKPLHRRTYISATAGADTQTLPQSAIQRIAEKLRSLGYVEESPNDKTQEHASIPHPNSPGEIFVPLPTHLPKHRVGHTLDPSWSTPENPVPEPGSGTAIQRFHDLRRGVFKEREEDKIRKRAEKESAPSLAELTLPAEELKRLRSLGIELKKKLKVGKAGITEGIVNGIHERWRRSELIKITVEDICRLNMKRTHDLLERKTGGLVVWRSGSNIILYRGPDYKYPYFSNEHTLSNNSSKVESPAPDMEQRILGKSHMPSSVTNGVDSTGLSSKTSNSQPPLVQGVGMSDRVRFQLPGEAQLAEEADTLLEGLGPRFKDWWGYTPLPVDADLLPAVVPGYKRPFRLLPYGVNPKLTDDEMTTLRRLCRPLPCHFALGRNRKHQGLAAAIVKLWEKCEIAKIAVKRGVQNTNSLLMAEELKWLTGGTLLSRDREFIVFYRGKDFLPAAASSAIEERRKLVLDIKKNSNSLKTKEHKNETEQNTPEVERNDENDPKISRHSEEKKLRLAELAMRRTDTKLSMALAKKAHVEKLLAELDNDETCKKPEVDKEGITEEERYMLRRVGLRMNAFLLLGRRGVFDGTVENMHLHWKYRELVKVCIGRRNIEEVHGVARTLEAESGGILVAVEPVSKGFAIIVYRGKNYKRPASLRPQTLLSKRAAMKRSIESQRRESLKLHVLKLNKNIDELKFKLDKDEVPEETHITEDVGQVFVKDQEMNQNHYKEDKEFHEDPLSDDESHAGDQANDEDREYPEMDVISTSTKDLWLSSEESMHIEEDIQGDVSESKVKGPYIFETLAQEVDPSSAVKESKTSPTTKQQSGNVEFPNHLWSRDGTSSNYVQPDTRGMNSNGGYHKAMADRPAVVMPVRVSQLSNRERLLLRKQALLMKKQPVLAIGKSNVVSGVAKVIKAHFVKHPLAIVNIKGRAKGTSAQEVIYNLEQATGGVLVSQEPSKIILYRGWGSVTETNKSKKDSSNGDGTGQIRVSRELISAIRLECGLNAASEERVASEAIGDEII